MELASNSAGVTLGGRQTTNSSEDPGRSRNRSRERTTAATNSSKNTVSLTVDADKGLIVERTAQQSNSDGSLDINEAETSIGRPFTELTLGRISRTHFNQQSPHVISVDADLLNHQNLTTDYAHIYRTYDSPVASVLPKTSDAMILLLDWNEGDYRQVNETSQSDAQSSFFENRQVSSTTDTRRPILNGRVVSETVDEGAGVKAFLTQTPMNVSVIESAPGVATVANDQIGLFTFR